MKPFNDNLKIELPTNDFITAAPEDDINDPHAGTGIVVGIPEIDDILYLGSYNWAFDQSMLNEKTAHQVHAKMTALLGKTVYFERRADIGVTVEDDGKAYAIIKLAKIMGYEL